MAAARPELVAAACSRTAHALDWLGAAPIAFGAGTLVALYDPADPADRGIFATLRGHTDRVNCVRFARGASCDAPAVLVSGSADCTARVWTSAATPGTAASWRCSAVLVSHTGSITALAAAWLPAQHALLITTAATDGTVRVFEHVVDPPGHIADPSRHIADPSAQDTCLNLAQDVHLEPVQVINIGARTALGMALAALPAADADTAGRDTTVILGTGDTDGRVHLYARDAAAGSPFAGVLELAGHEDWVTSLSFLTLTAADCAPGNATIGHWQPGDTILASGSQDKYVRLWRIQQAGSSADAEAAGDPAPADDAREPAAWGSDKRAAQAMLDAFASGLGTGASVADITSSVVGSSSLAGAEAPQLSTRAHAFTAGAAAGARRAYTVALDSVLVGHDGWVHSVAWGRAGPTPALLTASADSSAMLWLPDTDAGVWSSVSRFGEQGGAVQGFLGAAMSADGTAICAHGYQGSLHMWRRAPAGDAWTPRPSPSGHFAAVQDVCWDPRGSYLLSVSADQTARLFAPWGRAEGRSRGWHELARPQIHGYNMRCAAFVTPLQYVSGADEKVVRVFEATQMFVAAWRALEPGLDLGEGGRLAVGASLPVLGLSNKAVGQDQVQALEAQAATNAQDGAEWDDNYEVRRTHTDVVAGVALRAQQDGAASGQPPLEERLLRHTLWPEADKLYGHPYEIFALAAAHAGDLIATACRAASARHASIRLYSTRTWQPPAVRAAGTATALPAVPLSAHALTITRLRFSPPGADAGTPPDRYLLGVSRDRSWALFERVAPAPGDGDGEPVYEQPTGPYVLRRQQPKAHARIIWDAAWAPGARFFATASRDKAVKLWPVPDAAGSAAAPVTLAFPEAVTAVDFLPAQLLPSGGADVGHPQYALAAALESGRIFVLVSQGAPPAGSPVPAAWRPAEIPRAQTHAATVHRLAWRPRPGPIATERSWQLASASEDQTVRVTTIDL
ncbi:Elongator subunit elp2 [Coemansia biformis]|uniref:Elongator complex protein 2 n=1 Tax=Coemansia biformis TaxID=1286918 RepID=A0A9W7YDL9_9FUNG|nr:Elongator subunit elp2 [Coemansia biformis]